MGWPATFTSANKTDCNTAWRAKVNYPLLYKICYFFPKLQLVIHNCSCIIHLTYFACCNVLVSGKQNNRTKSFNLFCQKVL